MVGLYPPGRTSTGSKTKSGVTVSSMTPSMCCSMPSSCRPRATSSGPLCGVDSSIARRTEMWRDASSSVAYAVASWCSRKPPPPCDHAGHMWRQPSVQSRPPLSDDLGHYAYTCPTTSVS